MFLLDITDYYFFFCKECLAPLANFSAWSQVGHRFGYCNEINVTVTSTMLFTEKIQPEPERENPLKISS